jgi:SAM-dependent methyltransferase
MSIDHWNHLFQAWSRLARPERASPVALAAIKAQIAAVQGPVLLLGMTEGLFDAAPDLTAIDRSETVASDRRHSAPGRRVVVGDWMRLPFPAGAFAACIGDGSLIACSFPGGWTAALDAVARCLRPGGTFACRVFLAPDAGMPVAAVVAAARQRRYASFQIFKFSLAKAQCHENGSPNIAVPAIADCFDRHVPDRDAFAAATGWDRAEIDTIDVYRPSRASYAFPTAADCLAAVPPALQAPRLVSYPGHPMGAQWPILVAERS